ncbi:MAG: acyl-CoA thioesterase [Paracoccaceae bacterium]
MYPFIRMAWQMFKHRGDPKLDFDGVHISHHYCLPWDLDMWRELNNGRTLTLYDLGRIPLAMRVGLIGVLKRKRWGLTMAGATVRYRRRVRMFHKVEMHSRALGHDGRFIYLQQSMWRNGEALSSVVYRSAVTGAGGIVPVGEVLAAMGVPDWNPTLPDWVQAWIEVEGWRQWPPVDVVPKSA